MQLAFLCGGIVFDITVVWFVARFCAEAAACSVAAMFGNVPEFVALETLRGLGTAFQELAVMGLVALIDFLADHFVRLFGFSNTDQESLIVFSPL